MYQRTDFKIVCSDALLVSACSLLLVLSRSVRNLRTCIGDEPDLGTLDSDLLKQNTVTDIRTLYRDPLYVQ